jgi:hypothetical protein
MNQHPLKIKEILELPDLETMSDEKLEELLRPLIPAARTPNKTQVADAAADMLEKLSKIFGI